MSIPSSIVVVELKILRTPNLNKSCNRRFSFGASCALCSSAHSPMLKTRDDVNSLRWRLILGSWFSISSSTSSRSVQPVSGAHPSTSRGQICPVVGHRYNLSGCLKPNSGNFNLNAQTGTPSSRDCFCLASNHTREFSAWACNWQKAALRSSPAYSSILSSLMPHFLRTSAANLLRRCLFVAPTKRAERLLTSFVSAHQWPIRSLNWYDLSSSSEPKVIAPSVRSVSHNEARNAVQ